MSDPLYFRKIQHMDAINPSHAMELYHIKEIPTAGDKNSTCPLIITREIQTSALGRITRESHVTPLCSLLHTLLKDKCVCFQDE